MPAYEDARDALADAMGPVADYCHRAHETANAADPALAGKFRHVTQLESLVSAVIDYGTAAEAERLPPSPRIAALSARIRTSPAYLSALDRPDHHRALAGSLTSYCIPLPSHARPEPV